ncbi:hypothetical protein N7449_007268 [Penicillium cf. viridicatum]|uniref:Uncharacterized protein n=1 Tax=Penicillium cf. viridicatum TaxID=2972119 RepID=A0A9W9JI65_9EURO|nr:hypothetical protein N7449_007268 [Penicillium cf. viridicatum]
MTTTSLDAAILSRLYVALSGLYTLKSNGQLGSHLGKEAIIFHAYTPLVSSTTIQLNWLFSGFASLGWRQSQH